MKTRKHILPLAAAMGSLALTATSAQAGHVGQLGILDEAWFAANPINPDTGAPWQAGDTYHLAFTTVATVIQNTGGGGQSATDPMWADIANWDAIVQAEGDTVGGGAGAGVTWKVIGSTSTVDARDHTAVSGPVYNLFDGNPLASNFADMWDGEVANEITHIDGTSISSPSYAGLVWTGSFDDGTKTTNPLGDTDRFVSMGDPIANSGPVGSNWIDYGSNRNQDHWRPASIYGLSEALQVDGGAADPKITSITSVGSGVWQLTLEGESETAYEFRSSTTLDFTPGTLVEPLTDGIPAVGAIGGDNNSQLATDVDGNGTVRMTLAGPANYVVAQVPPPPPPLLDEDFESDNGGFTALIPTAGTDWEYGAPISNDLGGVANPGGSVTGGNDSSTKCWGTDIGNPGRYADPTTDSCLRSPNFDLTGASSAELTFAEALDLAAGDSAVVQLINVTGDVWIADVYTATDGDVSSADWTDANNGNPIDLSAGVGNTVYLQWCLTGNGGDDDDYMGWYIDDVVVTSD